MYNGIGLQTARGSGTNGYVQTNKFFVRPKTGRVAENFKGFEDDQGTAGVTKKANKDILEHDRKRQIELKLVVLEDKLVDQGYTDAEIAEKLEEARSTLLAAAASEASGGAVVSNEKVSDTQTHQVAARKEKQMEKLRAALGITVSGPEDALELEPGEIKDDQPKKSRKHVRNEGAEETEKSNAGHDIDDSDEPEAKENIKRKKLEGKHKRKKDESSSSDSESEREPDIRRKSKSMSRKQKKSRYDSSETDSDEKKAKRNSKKKRPRKDTDGDSDSDTVKKHSSKQRRRRYDSSDPDSAENDEKTRKMKSKRILKDSESDSGSVESDSFDSSSDTYSGEDKKIHVSRRPAHPSKIHMVDKMESREKSYRKQNRHKDDSSSESDSDNRTMKKQAALKIHKTDESESESDSADDGDAKREIVAKKGDGYAKREMGVKKHADNDDITDGGDRSKKHYKEEEWRWENKRSEEEQSLRSRHSAGLDLYKQSEYNKYEDCSKGDRARHKEDLSKSRHDRYKGTENRRSNMYQVDKINEERYDPRSEIEITGGRQSDTHELHTEIRRSDRHEEPRERRLGDRYDDGSNKNDKDREVVKEKAYYGDHEKSKGGNHGRSEVSIPERKSKREDYGRARLEKEDEDQHMTKRRHAREEEKERGSRRHERSGDAGSPKRARYNSDSPSNERRKDTGRHERLRR